MENGSQAWGGNGAGLVMLGLYGLGGLINLGPVKWTWTCGVKSVVFKGLIVSRLKFQGPFLPIKQTLFKDDSCQVSKDEGPLLTLTSIFSLRD